MEQEVTLVLEAAVLPEWIRLLPLGQVDLVDDRPPFEVDREAVAAMVEAFDARGVDLVVDYEHQSLNGGRAPAAGWIKEMTAKGDGLWARVEWTAQAQEYLRNKEYRYFSPVLKLDPDTRKPLVLMHVALTNVPAMKGVAPLVAKYGGEGPDQADKRPGEATEVNGEVLMELKRRLGLAPEVREDVLWIKTREFFENVSETLGLAEDAGSAEVQGSLGALKAGVEQIEDLKREIETLKSRLVEEQASRAVEEALTLGKISPAQKGWALEYCRQDAERFQAFVAGAPKVVPLGEVLSLVQGEPLEEGRLSPGELDVCRAVSITPAAYLKAKQQIDQAKY
jgi:phage I-like protein